MRSALSLLALATAVTTAASPLAAPQQHQQPLLELEPQLGAEKRPSRALTGKFLHVTGVYCISRMLANADNELTSMRGKISI
jgi:hypothetical protein